MKEMLKSKVMVLFIAMVLGLTYFDSLATERYEESKTESYEEVIVMNIK